MSDENQMLFNIAVGCAGFLAGWVITTLWSAVKDLQEADKALVDKISSIEVLVAGQYVKNEVFNNFIAAMFAKLDRIEDKLDSKADK